MPSGLLIDPVQLFEAFSCLLDTAEAALFAPALHGHTRYFSYDELFRVCGWFGHIVDSKRHFIVQHSTGVAEAAARMAQYYRLDEDDAAQFRIAAALHDIGKLAVPREILEKPAKLIPAEYEIVQHHVRYTHEILSLVNGFERINHWASNHYERLNGAGYSHGSTDNKLDFCSRLLACLDVFQALVEDRPYRPRMSLVDAFDILRDEAEQGKLDGDIVRDLETVYIPTQHRI